MPWYSPVNFFVWTIDEGVPCTDSDFSQPASKFQPIRMFFWRLPLVGGSGASGLLVVVFLGVLGALGLAAGGP